MPIENIKEMMTDEELRSLLKELLEESNRREREAKEKDWLAVREAIANFTKKWGNITVTDGYDTVIVYYGADMSTIGDITASA